MGLARFPCTSSEMTLDLDPPCSLSFLCFFGPSFPELVVLDLSPDRISTKEFFITAPSPPPCTVELPFSFLPFRKEKGCRTPFLFSCPDRRRLFPALRIPSLSVISPDGWEFVFSPPQEENEKNAPFRRSRYLPLPLFRPCVEGNSFPSFFSASSLSPDGCLCFLFLLILSMPSHSIIPPAMRGKISSSSPFFSF